jgi:hypothetical protein
MGIQATFAQKVQGPDILWGRPRISLGGCRWIVAGWLPSALMLDMLALSSHDLGIFHGFMVLQ